jgi:hypothetical protein
MCVFRNCYVNVTTLFNRKKKQLLSGWQELLNGSRSHDKQQSLNLRNPGFAQQIDLLFSRMQRGIGTSPRCIRLSESRCTKLSIALSIKPRSECASTMNAHSPEA